jgi:hypothetical protein
MSKDIDPNLIDMNDGMDTESPVKKERIRQARLPRAAYTSDLGEVMSHYARKAKQEKRTYHRRGIDRE